MFIGVRLNINTSNERNRALCPTSVIPQQTSELPPRQTTRN